MEWPSVGDAALGREYHHVVPRVESAVGGIGPDDVPVFPQELGARRKEAHIFRVEHVAGGVEVPRARADFEPELVVLRLRRKRIIDLGKIGRIEIVDPEQVPAHIDGEYADLDLRERRIAVVVDRLDEQRVDARAEAPRRRPGRVGAQEHLPVVRIGEIGDVPSVPVAADDPPVVARVRAPRETKRELRGQGVRLRPDIGAEKLVQAEKRLSDRERRPHDLEEREDADVRPHVEYRRDGPGLVLRLDRENIPALHVEHLVVPYDGG